MKIYEPVCFSQKKSHPKEFRKSYFYTVVREIYRLPLVLYSVKTFVDI